ncbi:MAG: hypothetical protein Q7T80_17110 [Methanoregula sp.]|nr:hypothetical protein [Methanoregula sp.]
MPVNSSVSALKISEAEAKNIVLAFIGRNDSSLKFSGDRNCTTITDILTFSSDSGEFQVNSATSQLQQVHFYNTANPLVRNVDLEKAEIIAESYAREQNPDFWTISDLKGVKKTLARLNPTYHYYFIWREQLYFPDNHSPNHYTITGDNSIAVAVTESGSILDYYDRIVPSDPMLSLNPELTEDQAWIFAESAFEAEESMPVLGPPDKQGLWIIQDKDNTQHLTWRFEAGGAQGHHGMVFIDAHNGSLVRYSGYM